jgi:23S rRNA pseudouridine1911/1915/1917 synthase
VRSFDRKKEVALDSWKVDDAEVGLRLDGFLAIAGRLGSRGRAAKALERGKVFLNDEEAGPDLGSHRLVVGDRVRVWMDRPGSAHSRYRRPAGSSGPSGRERVPPIVYEDDLVIVVNKPPGLLTVPLAARADAASVAQLLGTYLRNKGRRQALAVHRLDRDTSGLVVFATDRAAQHTLKEQFVRREPERVYLAVVEGTPSPTRGVWRDSLIWDSDMLVQTVARPGDRRAHEAGTEFEVVDSFRGGLASLLRLRLVTGKRNQIRVQAQLHGHPLFGEHMYAGGGVAPVGVTCERQALHASRLAFDHPRTGQRMAFEAPLPADLERLLRQLRENRGRPGRPR